MYQRLLAEVEAAQARYGEQPQLACPPDRLARLRRRVRQELGATLPDEYADFPRARDGLNHHGLFIYASETAPVVGAPGATIQGLVEAHLDWREVEQMSDYLVFGEGNMDLYARHLPTGEHRVLDRVPGNLVEQYPSFELLLAALKAHL